MKQKPNFRRASRTFELMVHEGVPEAPQPMYQEDTYGKTPPRFTGQASETSGTTPPGKVAAVYVLRDAKIVAESPAATQKNDDSAQD